MYGEAVQLLSGVKNPQNPLFLYYMGYCLSQNGRADQAQKTIQQARNLNYDYVFPYRSESERVLRYAISADPSSPYGHYLLGNLLYENRPDEAMAAWKAAAEIEPDQPMIQRNLAFGAYHHQHQADRAIELLANAIELSPDHPLWYDELLTYYEASGRGPEECLRILAENEEIVRRNVSAPKGLVKLYNLNGKFDHAIRLLDSHHFRTWEGGRSIYWYHVDAHVLKATELMSEEYYPEAISHLKRAMEYPENLEVGKPTNDERNALVYYLTGLAYEKMDHEELAMEAFAKSAGCENSRAWPDLDYYQGLSFTKLGEPEKATEKFNELESRAERMLEEGRSESGIGIDEDGSAGTMKSVSEGYYLLGLAYLGKGDSQRAQEMFTEAVKRNQYNLWAQYYHANGNIGAL
jgi:tetratricopeptide (TPR) repeat protein